VIGRIHRRDGEVRINQAEVGVGRNHVNAIGQQGHFASHLTHRHSRRRLEHFSKPAFMVGR